MKKTKNKNPYYKFGLAIALLAFLVVPHTTNAQSLCTNSAVFNTCVEINGVDPAQPIANQNFTVNGTVTASDMNSAGSAQIILYENISFGSDIQIGAPVNVTLTPDASGNASATFQFTESASGSLTPGNHALIVVVENSLGAQVQSGDFNVTVQNSGPVSENTLIISSQIGSGGGGIGTDPTGQNWNFNASYIPEGFSTPTLPDGVAIGWTFGDGGSADGLNVSHSYLEPGSYNVQATAFDFSGNVIATSNLLTINTQAAADSGSNTPVIDGIGATILLVVNMIVGFILSIISAVYYLIMTALVLPLINAMVSLDVRNINDFVTEGWGIIRNIANLIFLLALVVIGLSMVLRVQSYGNKRLIGMLLIMALLVNFSLTIGIAIIDVADAFTNTFLGDNRTQVTQTVYDRFFSINGGFTFEYFTQSWRALANGPNLFADQSQILVGGIFGAIMQIASLFVFLYFAAILLLRFAAIWILLVLSPLAYAFFVLPQTQRFASQWWSRFLGWTFILPIMSFFLYIIALVPEFPVDSIPATGQNVAFADLIRNNLQYIIILTFLWAAIYVSKMGALSGSQFFVGKMGAAIGGAYGFAAGYGSRGFARIAKRQSEKAESHKRAAERLHKSGKTAAAAESLRLAKRASFGAGLAGAGTLVSPKVAKSAYESWKQSRESKMDLAKAVGADVGAFAAGKTGGNLAAFNKRQVLAAEKKIKDNGEDRDPDKLIAGLEEALKKGNAVLVEAYLGEMASNKVLTQYLQSKGKEQDVRGLREFVFENQGKLKQTDEQTRNMLAGVATAAAKVHDTQYVGAERGDKSDTTHSESLAFQKSVIESMSQNDLAKLSPKAFLAHLDTVMPNFTDQRSANNVPVSTIAEIVNDKDKLKEAFKQNQTGTLHMLEKLASLDDDRLKDILAKTSTGIQDKGDNRDPRYAGWNIRTEKSDSIRNIVSQSVDLNTINTKDFEKLSRRLNLNQSGEEGPTIVVPPATGENRRSRTVFPEGGPPREE